MAKTPFSLKNIRNFWRKVQQSEGCWTWTGSLDRNGYGKIRVEYRLLGAHRFSWELHHSAIPEGLCVCHRCDNPCCVNPDHLFLGTAKENIADKVAKGRHMRNGAAVNAKLTAEDVDHIRGLLASGRSQRSVAREFNTHHSNIYCIKTGRSWRAA